MLSEGRMQRTGQRATNCSYLHSCSLESSQEDAIEESGTRQKGSSNEKKKRRKGKQEEKQIGIMEIMRSLRV